MPRRSLLAPAFAALVASAMAADGTQPVDFAPGGTKAEQPALELCVRGETLDETRTVHLRLHVRGAVDLQAAPDVAARFGAALADLRLWHRFATRLSGQAFDPSLCGPEVAAEESLSVALDADQWSRLRKQSGLSDADWVEAVAAALPPAAGFSKALPLPQPTTGEAVTDAQGRIAYRLMNVYYATDRGEDPKAAPGQRFGTGRGALAFGLVRVTIPWGHHQGAIESPSIFRLEFREDPAKHVMVQSLEALTATQWRQEVAARAQGLDKPGILLFIHGYNVTFAEGAQRAGQLAFDLNFPGATVLFSWPSQGALSGYTVDEQNAEWAISDMKQVLSDLAATAPGAPVYIVAHSMGNRVLARGFKALLDTNQNAAHAFSEIVLAAPDLDADVFTREIAPAILDKGPRVTLYASSNDKALAASRELHGGYRRLGESGENLIILHPMETVDASSVSTELLGHGYIADSDVVGQDLKLILHRGLAGDLRSKWLEAVSDARNQIRYWKFRPVVAAP